MSFCKLSNFEWERNKISLTEVFSKQLSTGADVFLPAPSVQKVT